MLAINDILKTLKRKQLNTNIDEAGLCVPNKM